MSAEIEQSASSRQVKARQSRLIIWIQRRIEFRIRDSQIEIFSQKSMGDLNAGLQIVHFVVIGNVRLQSQIAQTPTLRDSRREIRQPVSARSILDLILPEKWIEGERCRGVEQMHPAWRNVVGA